MPYEYIKTELNERKAIGIKKRVCLSCGKPFLSEHVHNRLCSICKESGTTRRLNSKWANEQLNKSDG